MDAPPPPLKIVHIGPDSPHLRFAANTFESVAPGANEYLVVGTAGALRYPVSHGVVTVVSPSPLGVLSILARRPKGDLIVAHSMTAHATAAFARAGRRTATVWSGWGYDFYGPETEGSLLGPKTRALVDELARSRSVAHRPLWRRSLTGAWNGFARTLKRRAAARTDYLSVPVPGEEAVFRSQFPQFRGQTSQLSYFSLEESFATHGADRPSGTGILLGNSATPTNNHLEALDLLAGRELGGRRIVVPLSYGDPAYRDAIVERGTQLFGTDFVPLIERMPLDKYNALVAGCDVVIMNHRRQQALGNIGTALNAGATVYLDEANPVYPFFRRSGASVRSTSELATASSLAHPLTDDQLAANRSFLKSFWGTEQVRENVAALLRRIGEAS